VPKRRARFRNLSLDEADARQRRKRPHREAHPVARRSRTPVASRLKWPESPRISRTEPLWGFCPAPPRNNRSGPLVRGSATKVRNAPRARKPHDRPRQETVPPSEPHRRDGCAITLLNARPNAARVTPPAQRCCRSAASSNARFTTIVGEGSSPSGTPTNLVAPARSPPAGFLTAYRNCAVNLCDFSSRAGSCGGTLLRVDAQLRNGDIHDDRWTKQTVEARSDAKSRSAPRSSAIRCRISDRFTHAPACVMPLASQAAVSQALASRVFGPSSASP